MTDRRENRTVSIYIVASPAVSDDRLRKTIEDHSIPAVLLEAERPTDIIERIQQAGCAVITPPGTREPHDGLHLENDVDLFSKVRREFSDLTVGYGGVSTRHDAMVATEAGADYVGFGRLVGDTPPLPLELRVDLCRWWQDMMQTPCVAKAEDLETAATLSRAGADFVAVGDWAWAEADFNSVLQAVALRGPAQ
ncbi:MAG: thiamine phosphate synthase [Pseudomonadota bacterium]